MTTSGAASSRENVLAASPAGSKALHSATAALVAVNVLVFLAISSSSTEDWCWSGAAIMDR
jgi:hypothetical protein